MSWLWTISLDFGLWVFSDNPACLETGWAFFSAPEWVRPLPFCTSQRPQGLGQVVIQVLCCSLLRKWISLHFYPPVNIWIPAFLMCKQAFHSKALQSYNEIRCLWERAQLKPENNLGRLNPLGTKKDPVCSVWVSTLLRNMLSENLEIWDSWQSCI